MQSTKEKNFLKIKRVLIFIIIIIAFCSYLFLNKGDVIQINVRNTSSDVFDKKDIYITYSPESNPIFYSYNHSEIFFITKDSVKLLNLNGEVIWEHDIKLNSPQMIGNGGSIGVIEHNGNTLHIFNKSGLLYTKNFSNRIFNFNINENGFSSVILINDNEYRIQIFNNNGTLIWEFPFNIQNIFPVTIDISDDNRIVAYGTIDINGILLQSDAIFAYINEIDSIGFENTIFGSKKLENETIGLINFYDKDAVVITNQEIHRYNMGKNNLITDTYKIKLNNYIERIDISKNGNLVLVLGGNNLSENGVKNNTVQFFNSRGNLTGEIQIDDTVTYLSYKLNTAIVGLGRTFYGINSKGDIIWKYEATQDIKQVLYLNNERSLLVVGNTEAYILERNR